MSYYQKQSLTHAGELKRLTELIELVQWAQFNGYQLDYNLNEIQKQLHKEASKAASYIYELDAERAALEDRMNDLKEENDILKEREDLIYD